MRLAWMTPWPPDRTGVAGRSAEIVPMLAARGHAIDVFVDESRVPCRRAPAGPPVAGAVRVQGAHNFLWRAMRHQYDLVVYQVGNSRWHEFIWPYVWRVPGLAVLHDARLHHARGKALLSSRRRDAYRAEFAWDQPLVSPDAAELAVAGFPGTYYYQWPMTRAVIESSRLVAAHSRGAVAEIAASWPGRPVAHIALGEGRGAPIAPDLRQAWRRQLHLRDDAIVFGVFGGLTEEKRIDPILRGIAGLRRHVGHADLLLAGSPAQPAWLNARIAELGLGSAVSLVAQLDDEGFDAAIAAVDVSLNLRWPSAQEMSGPWLRALAAERPTVIFDLGHLSDIPALDPRTWQLHPPGRPGARPADAVTVALDLLDEDHSLRLALRRLATDTDFRRQLGRTGRSYWESAHTVMHMADDYEFAMARGASLPAPAADLPAHLRPDPATHARALAAPFGVSDRLPS